MLEKSGTCMKIDQHVNPSIPSLFFESRDG